MFNRPRFMHSDFNSGSLRRFVEIIYFVDDDRRRRRAAFARQCAS